MLVISAPHDFGIYIPYSCTLRKDFIINLSNGQLKNKTKSQPMNGIIWCHLVDIWDEKSLISRVNFHILGGHFIHRYLEYLAVVDTMVKVFSGFLGF